MALASTLTHRKTRKLASQLHIPLLYALGIAEAIFLRTYDAAPRGDIGRLSNDDIALEIHYEGDADELIAALVSAGYLDADPVHRLIVHDWHEHCTDAVANRVARTGLNFANDVIPRMSRLSQSDKDQVAKTRDSKRLERESESARRLEIGVDVARRAQPCAFVRTTTPHHTTPETPPHRASATRSDPKSAKSTSNPEKSLTERHDLVPANGSSPPAAPLDSQAIPLHKNSTDAPEVKSARNRDERSAHISETRVYARDTAAHKSAQKRTAIEDDASDTEVTPDMVAGRVMVECVLSGMHLRLALSEVARSTMHNDPDITSTQIADSMVSAWRRYEHERKDLRITWNAEKFFGEGHWRDPESWPRKDYTTGNGGSSKKANGVYDEIMNKHLEKLKNKTKGEKKDDAGRDSSTLETHPATGRNDVRSTQRAR